MAIARFLDRMCRALRTSGLWLRYIALQNLIPWIAPPCPPPWRNPRKRRDQILPSGNLGEGGEGGKPPPKLISRPLLSLSDSDLPDPREGVRSRSNAKFDGGITKVFFLLPLLRRRRQPIRVGLKCIISACVRDSEWKEVLWFNKGHFRLKCT